MTENRSCNNNSYDIGIPISEQPSNDTLGRKIIVTASIDEENDNSY